MPVRRPLRSAMLAAVALAAAACTPAAGGDDVPTATGESSLDAKVQALADAQRRTSEQALDSLAARECPPLPERTQLSGLPDDPLACLGTGPARPVAAGDGRPTVVNLWASWCPPCVDEMPLLQRTADRAGDGVRFVGVDIEDERASAAALLQATGVRYPSYEDPDGLVRDAVRAVGLPVTLVYDADGREVARKLGQVDEEWLAAALDRAGAPLPAGG